MTTRKSLRAMLADRLRLPASTPHKPLAEARIALKKKLEAGDRVTCPGCGQVQMRAFTAAA